MTGPRAHVKSGSSLPRLLCVDSEPFVLDAIKTMLGDAFAVKTATGGPDALMQLRLAPGAFAVIVADLKMPNMSGATFLRHARHDAPDSMPILLAGQLEREALFDAINEAQPFRVVPKPCDFDALHDACTAALAEHRQRSALRMTAEHNLGGCLAALLEMLARTTPSAAARGERVRVLVEKLGRTAGVHAAEAATAAQLAPLGACAVAEPTLQRYYDGEELSHAEAESVARIPATTQRILERVPGLETVTAILECLHGSGAPAVEGTARAAQLLRLAGDYDKLERRGIPQSAILSTLATRSDRYTPALLTTLSRALGVVPDAEGEVEVTVRQLTAGMRLADDIRSAAGSLLIAHGTVVSEQLIARLAKLGPGAVREPLRVITCTDETAGGAPATPAPPVPPAAPAAA